MINMTKVFFPLYKQKMHLYIMKISYGVLQKEEGLCMKHCMRLFPMQTPIWYGFSESAGMCSQRNTWIDLIYGHQLHVPFENLDVWMFQKDIPLDIEAIYEKVVTKHRGGYCLN